MKRRAAREGGAGRLPLRCTWLGLHGSKINTCPPSFALMCTMEGSTLQEWGRQQRYECGQPQGKGLDETPQHGRGR